jgi:hypothetical protein
MIKMSTKISVRGKYLSDFPEIVAQLDLSKHKDIDCSEIKAGSNQKLNWICEYCNENYLRNPNERVKRLSGCPKKECMLLKRSKTNNERFGWTPKYDLSKREITENKINTIQELSIEDIEEWSDIPEELLLSKYKISSLGRIKNKQTRRILSIKPVSDGYIRTNLSLNNNILKHFYIHRIVALTFIPNPENKPTVNHINTIKDDNRVINLEWATFNEQSYKENRKPHKQKIGLKKIYQCDLEGNIIKKWDKAIDAENALNINRKNILKVLKGERKQSGGFIWKYCEKENTEIEDEVWKKVPLGNELVETFASSLGRIKRRTDGEPVYGTLRESGYYDIGIPKINEKNKKKTFRAHRLVALAFIDNPENKPFVNHIDENKSNNAIINLEWMTNKENVNYSRNLKKEREENY